MKYELTKVLKQSALISFSLDIWMLLFSRASFLLKGDGESTPVRGSEDKRVEGSGVNEA